MLDSAGVSTSSIITSTPLSDLLLNGGIAAGLGVIASLLLLYCIVIRRRRRSQNTTAAAAAAAGAVRTETFSMANPLKRHERLPASRNPQQPKAPKSHPPKHAFTSFEHTHTENYGSVNSSDNLNSLRLATTINPLRAGRSNTTISTKR